MSMGPSRVSRPPLFARRESYPPEDYVIGIICPLEVELTAMVGMLDIEHNRHSRLFPDGNTYRLGAILGYKTVITGLPAGHQGKVVASQVANRFARTFPNVQLRLVVGIGGGIPNPADVDKDIRLGDVVVSVPNRTGGGVVEYDLGKRTNEGFERKGILPAPQSGFFSTITEMRIQRSMRGYDTIMDCVKLLQRRETLRDKYKRPPATTDLLFKSDYHHVPKGSSCCLCDRSRLISRVQREPSDRIMIHYGLIGSGDSVIKSAEERDLLGEIEGVLCFEMEAAGIMHEFPSIVIRGISDYADSHKNDCWQPFAAATAAAVAREYIECARGIILGFVANPEIHHSLQPALVPVSSHTDFNESHGSRLPTPESTIVDEDDGSWETVHSKKKRVNRDSPWQTKKDASTFSSRVGQKNMLNANPVPGRGMTITPNQSRHQNIVSGAHQDDLLTYRISGLDPDVTEEDVRDFLDERFSHITVKQRKAPIHYVGLTALSDTQQVAIVELSQTPKSFCPRNPSDTKAILPEQSHFNTEIYIDGNFNGVTPLRAPLSRSPAESLSQVNVDMIVISSPGEHPYGSWKMPNGNLWIDDFLARAGVKNIRVSLVGCSNVASADNEEKRFSRLVERLKEELKRLCHSPDRVARPIVFLSQGCGGRVVMQALLDLQHDGEMAVIQTCVGVFQIGLPYSPMMRHKFEESLRQFQAKFLQDPQYSWMVLDRLDPNMSPVGIASSSITSDAHHPTQAIAGFCTFSYDDFAQGLYDCVRNAQDTCGRHSSASSEWDQESTYRSAIEQMDASNLFNSFSKLVDPLKSRKKHSIEKYNPDHIWLMMDPDFQKWVFSKSHSRIGVSTPPERDQDLASCYTSLKGDKSGHKKDLNTQSFDVFFSCNKESPDSVLQCFVLSLAHDIIRGLQPDNHVRRKALEKEFLQNILTAGIAEATLPKTEMGISECLSYILDRLNLNISKPLELTLGRKLGSTTVVLVIENLHFLPYGNVDTSGFIRKLRKIFDWLKKECYCFKVLCGVESRPDVIELLQNIHWIEYDKERKECSRTLDSHNSRYVNIETRHPETLKWIWKTKEFVDWYTSRGSKILHLEGKPASGKSVMAKYVASELKGHWGNYGGDVLATYFFNGADPEYSNHRMMLQSVLCSILSQAPNLFYQFREIYREHKDAINRDGWALEWLQLILDNCKRHPNRTRIYLIIDGLDEFTNYEAAGQVLNSLGGNEYWVTKIFVTSRAHEKASSFLDGSYKIVLEMENTTDITKYTASFLKKEFKTYQPTIVERSGNIFLWVRLVEAQVRRYREADARWSKAQFDEFLRGLHPQLSELYGSLFQRLQLSNDENFVRECRHMFQLVLAACRTLSAAEFDDALSILYNGDKIMSQDFNLPFERLNNQLRTWIVKYTVNFIELRGPTGKNGNIEFLHQSAREFFLEPYGDLNPNSGLAILWDRVAGHNTLIRACVNCICYFLTHVNSVIDFTSPGEFWMEGSWSTFVKYLDDLPLLPYCMDHLKHHLKKSEMEEQEWKRLQDAFRSPTARLLSTWLDRPDDFMPPRENHPLSDDQVQTIKNHLLHEAASECKGIAVKVLLQLGAEVNSRSPSNRNESALNLALSSYRQPGDPVARVVDTLLKHGADLKTRTFYGGIPLHYAAGRGHMQAVHQLLANSTDLEVLDKDQMTPLHRAVIYGWDDVAKRLITAGARVHVADANGLKPIHWAASKGHLSCVELLLKHGADINDRCNSLTVPLHWACGHGREDVVRCLVENGANILNYDRLKKTALRWAARYGHVGIVKYLVKKGLNVNWTESSGRTALHWAAQKGHLEVVRILLKAGADVNITERHGTDALSWAVTYGHIEIVRLLLRHSADAFRKDNGGRTLLHWSAAKGRVEVMEALLETGLKANLADTRGHTSLSLATRYNHIDVVKTLLAHSADPNFAGEGRRAPLFWAASYGHVEVLHRLIKSGANVNAQNDAGETPLHWAAAKGHESVISDLIKRYHADSNIRDNTGKIYTDCLQEFKEQEEHSDWDQRDSTDDVDDSLVIEPRY